jgi:uncharacterized membrane protein
MRGGVTRLKDAKELGGVGSILVLLSFVPIVGFVLGIAGLILILMASKHISDAVNEREIFENVLIAVILLIFSEIIALAWFNPFMMIASVASFAFLGILIVGLIVLWVILVVASWFLRKGFVRIAARTGTATFDRVGRWYFYGALLVIVLVGFIIILIAEILQIVAFFSLPESPPAQPTTEQPSGIQPL